MENSLIYDLIILGGGCAGLTAGIYAGRAMLKAAVLERLVPGGQAASTDDIENYPGFESIPGPELMSRMADQAKAFGTEIITADVKKADLAKDIKIIETNIGIFKARAVIIATGATPKRPGFKGEEKFRGRGVGYCATCDGFFFRGKDIFVIGGGDSAAQEAVYLTRFGKKVTLVVRKDRLRCSKTAEQKLFSNPKIEVRFNTEITEVFGDDLLKGAVMRNNLTGETSVYEASKEDGTFGIFVFIGYEPATELFKGQVETDEFGYIVTNELMETNLSGVYAAGDLRPKVLRQLVTAASDGAVAVSQAEKYLSGD